MTTNQERAAEVLRDDKHYKMGPHGEQFLTSEAIRSLADAGLLMQDMPEPELVDALIAEKRENQRIRTELEAVLDVVKHETWLHDDEGQFPETVQLGSYVAGQLARILEATDE